MSVTKLNPSPQLISTLQSDDKGSKGDQPLSGGASPAALVDAALTAQHEDSCVEAERLCREALAIDPNHAETLQLLGVLRMQRFDHTEALEILRRSGELTNWSIASYRQNYATCLSTFLSARELENIDERLRKVQAQRAVVSAARTANAAAAPTYSVAVVAAGAPLHAVAATLRSLATLTPRPIEVVLMGVGAIAANNGPFPLRTAPWPAASAQAAAALSAVFAATTARYAVVLHAGDVMQPKFVDALSALDVSGARWGVARCIPEALPEFASVAAALDHSFTELARTARVAASLLCDPNPIAMACNVLWDREFLLSRLAEQPADFHALTEFSLWQNEPVCLAQTAFQFGRRLRASGEFWKQVAAPIEIESDGYLFRALSGRAAPNALAPSIEANGLAFLKPMLRANAGVRLSPAALRSVATLVLGQAPLRCALGSEGIELVGFARTETGLGESLRLLAHSCDAVGLPLAITNISHGSGNRDSDRSMDQWIIDSPTYDLRVLCMNPNDTIDGCLADGPFVFGSSYNVGYWYWELETLPPLWSDCAWLVDEVWVATEFVAMAARKSIDRPVMKIMPPVDARQPSRRYARAEFGLPEAAFVFMFSFDFWSYPERKNPEAVVRAFKLAFDEMTRDVHLVIKYHGTHPARHAVLLAVIAGDPRITLLNQTLSRDALIGLQSVIDCFVSLHRSEGLGLGLAECMALGKPVIGTGYSGNLEFMREENSLLVDYSLIDVKADQYPHWRGQRWAEPNVNHAAQHMRRLFEDRAFASALGLAGQKTVRTEFSREHVGQRIRAQFDRIRNARNRRAVAP